MFVKHVMHVSACLCVTECKCVCVTVNECVYMCVYMSASVIYIFIVLTIMKICYNAHFCIELNLYKENIFSNKI